MIVEFSDSKARKRNNFEKYENDIRMILAEQLTDYIERKVITSRLIRVRNPGTFVCLSIMPLCWCGTETEGKNLRYEDSWNVSQI